MHNPPFCWVRWGGGGGAETPTKFSKREGLDKTSILRGVSWERGGDLLQGSLQSLHKKQTKI